MGIKPKILAPVLAVVFAVAVAAMISSITLISDFIDGSTMDRINAVSRVVAYNREDELGEDPSTGGGGHAGAD